MNTKIATLLFFIIGTNLVYSQESLSFKELIPKQFESPNVASLNKFVEFPIDYFNGTLDVSFPIYEINLKGGFTLPITLKYHTGGVRVNEEASWVGLGWALSVGGHISRQIAGLDDNYANGYNNKYGKYFPSISDNGTYNPAITGKVVSGKSLPNQAGQMVDVLHEVIYKGSVINSEPDLYIYQFGGFSGKFVKDYNGNPVDLSLNSIKFSHYYTPETVKPDSIVAITPDGCIYKFKDVETSYSITGSIPLGGAVDDYLRPQSTSYLLSEIITPYGESVRFFYKSFADLCTSKGWQLQYPGFSKFYSRKHYPMPFTLFESVCHRETIDDGTCFGYNNEDQCKGGYIGGKFDEKKLRSYTFNRSLFLEKIDFPGGTVSFFFKTPRHDSYSVKLDSIAVKSFDESFEVKSFGFNYGYFVGESPWGEDSYTSPGYGESYDFDFPLDYVKKRLKLLSFTEFGSEDLTHHFKYNETRLPHKTSFAQDFWGYYNGQHNTTLLPSANYSSNIGVPEFFRGRGANRNVFVDYAKAAALTEVIYPTGGRTVFTYEGNQASNFSYGLRTNIPGQTILACDPMLGPEMSESASGIISNEFVISEEMICDINITLMRDQHIPSGWSDNLPSYHFVSVEYLNPRTSNYWQTYYQKDEYFVWNTVDQPVRVETFRNRVLQPGRYRLVANYPYGRTTSLGSNMAQISVVCKGKEITDWKNEVGGLRISSIEHFDDSFTSRSNLSKKFVYEDGVLATYPSFFWETWFTLDHLCLVSAYPGNFVWVPQTKAVSKRSFNASPVYPYSFSANGSVVGYKKVIEANADGGIGRIEYKYSMTSDNTVQSHLKLPGIPALADPRNGLLEATKVFDYRGNLVSERVLEYTSLFDPEVFWAFKVDPTVLESDGDQCTFHAWVNTFFYPIVRGRHLLSKETQTLYSESGSVNIFSKNNYSLPAFPFPTSIEGVDSKQQEVVKYLFYPENYYNATGLTNIQRSALLKLRGQNRITPFQESMYVDGKLVTSSRVNYGEWDISEQKCLILPESFVTKNKEQRDFDVEYSIDSYDSWGNPTCVSYKDGRRMSYIWGYNHQYPIAKVENAKSSEIYHTSFEDRPLIKGARQSFDMTRAKTGRYSLLLSKTPPNETYSWAPFVDVDLTKTVRYKYSCWVYSDGPSADLYFFMKPNRDNEYYSSGWSAVYKRTTSLNQWVYLEGEVDVPATTKRIYLRVDNNATNGGGNVWFDDLRFHPVDAQMSTYTYVPLVGLTSETDPNGLKTQFVYDLNNRLEYVLDNEGNVLQHYKYNHKD